MEVAARPWFATGVAMVGASALAIAPIQPVTTWSAVPKAAEVRAAVAPVFSPEVRLTADSIPYILTLPIVRAQIYNYLQNWANYIDGFTKAGVATVQSIAGIPEVASTILADVRAGNLPGAFDTFTGAVREAVVAIGEPLLNMWVWPSAKAYAVQGALAVAVPTAFLSVVNGFAVAGGDLVNSLLVSTQNVVAAVLSGNLSNVVDAIGTGVRDFVGALGTAGTSVVSGIEGAQYAIATALRTNPPGLTPPVVGINLDDPANVSPSLAASSVAVSAGPSVEAASEPEAKVAAVQRIAVAAEPIDAPSTEGVDAAAADAPKVDDATTDTPAADDPKAGTAKPDASDAPAKAGQPKTRTTAGAASSEKVGASKGAGAKPGAAKTKTGDGAGGDAGGADKGGSDKGGAGKGSGGAD